MPLSYRRRRIHGCALSRTPTVPAQPDCRYSNHRLAGQFRIPAGVHYTGCGVSVPFAPPASPPRRRFLLYGCRVKGPGPNHTAHPTDPKLSQTSQVFTVCSIAALLPSVWRLQKPVCGWELTLCSEPTVLMTKVVLCRSPIYSDNVSGVLPYIVTNP